MVRSFELRQLVAETGSGKTYRAYQPSTGREVAIKIAAGALQHDSALQGSFEDSARRISELDHPNVLPLLDWWREAGQACLVTAWIRGGNLEDAIRREQWSLAAALRLADQIGSALAAAHREGITHGNLTARNVLLDSDRNGIVSDFSLRRVSETDGVRRDVRSLGVLLIRALVGRPGNGQNPALMLSQARADVPADLIAVLAQATSAVVTDRHGRMDDLLRDIRRAAGVDVVASAATEPPKHVRNPYKGLQAFEETDAPDFFGRSRLIERLEHAVATHRLVVVAGPSGSGKSSLVRAGLLPALRTGDKRPADRVVASMFPGSFPFEELERALLRLANSQTPDLYARLTASDDGLTGVAAEILDDNEELLLLVDQLEEVWSLVDQVEQRRRFLAALVRAATAPLSRVRIVATLRADFLDRAIATRDFGELTREGLVLVTPPSADDLREAVTMPGQQVGLTFEEGLVDRIVSDVDDQPGALPLLQHALTELAGSGSDERLTLAAYRAIGGVTGALGRRAESVNRELPAAAREVARQVFLRLVSVDERRGDTRRRVRRTELAALNQDKALIDEILRRFAAHRLLTFDRDPVTRGPTVEVAHEALFTEWPRLRDWISERRGELMQQRRLRAATNEWRRADDSPDYLLAGGRLDELESWAAATDLVLSRDERQLLMASRARQATEESSRRRRKRLTLASLLTLGLFGLGVAAVSLSQMGRVEESEREARARALAAASSINLQRDHDLALLLALDSVSTMTNAGAPALHEAVNALHAATINHRTQALVQGGLFPGFSGPSAGVSFGPPLERPIMWDSRTGQINGYLDAPSGEFGDATVSLSGRLAASTFADQQTWVWDLSSREPIARLGTAGESMIRPAISGDDRLLAVIEPGAGYTVSIYDLAAETRITRFDIPGWRRVAFGRHGEWLAVADEQAPVARLYDPSSGAVLGSLGQEQVGGRVWDLAVDGPGDLLALYLQEPNRVEIYDVAARRLMRSIPLATEPGGLCFTDHGKRLVGQGADQQLHVWDVRTGVEQLTLPSSGMVVGLACASDGQMVALSGPSGATRIYDLAATATTEIGSTAVVDPFFGTWMPDGTIVVMDRAGGLQRIDSTGKLLASAEQQVVAFQPGWMPVWDAGTLVAVAMPDEDGQLGKVGLFDTQSLTIRRTIDEPGFAPLAFSDDGRLLLAAADRMLVFDVAGGRPLGEPVRLPGQRPPIASGVFLPGGEHVVLKPLSAREAWVYETSSGAFVGTICTSQNALRAIVDEAHGRLLIADHQGAIEEWRLDGLLDAISGSPDQCAGDGANASDAYRVATLDVPGEGGIEVSPDGRWIAASSGYEGTLSVLDAATGEPVFEIQHGTEIGLAGFSPDSRSLAVAVNQTGSSLDAMRIYALEVDDLVDLARSKSTRTLTASECAAYEAISCSGH